MLSRYYLPVATTPTHESAVKRWVPGRLREPILTELRRRPIPPHVPENSVRRVGSASDIARVVVRRASRRAGRWTGVSQMYLDFFDRRVSRDLRAGDRAVVAVAGSARRTLRSAQRLGAVGFLDCPLAHHRFLDAVLKEEARLVPDYAPTLQLYSERRLAWLDEELGYADRLFVLSTFERQTFIDLGVEEERVILWPLGVDLDLFRPGQRPDDGVFRIIFVGQITQRKGISYLVEAFRQASIPRSELVLVGQPVGAVDPWVRIPGIKHVPPMPRSQLPTVYASADVFVLPSLVEGFGLTGMEAMACGLPVVLSEHTLGRDVITDGVEGYVVPIRDPQAIAEHLQSLATDPDGRRRMGLAARSRAEQYSWDASGLFFADQIETVLREAT